MPLRSTPHPARNRTRIGLLLTLSATLPLATPAPTHAQLPLPKLTTVFPAGASAGSTTEISIAGSDLDDTTTLVFSQPGLVAQPKPGAPLTFLVSIPANPPPGPIDVRAASRFGLSNPRTFVLGHRPEITAPTTNTSPATPLDHPLDTPCHGHVLAAQTHWFRFHAQAGQRILAHLQSRDIDSRLVPDLAVFDAAERELAIARRTRQLDFTAPADGTYLLRVHDQTFRGGPEFFFRLTLDSDPSVEFVVPPILEPGAPRRVTIFGRHLPQGKPGLVPGPDGRPLEELEVDVTPPPLNPTSPPARQPLPAPRRPAATTFTPVPLPIHLPPSSNLTLTFPILPSPGPVLTLPTTSRTQPASWLPITPPAEIGGLFPGRGESAGISFTAKQDDVFWLELTAERLGFHADPRAVVQRISTDAAGRETTADVLELNDLDANHGGREFDTSTRDAAGRLAIPADGTYRVSVRNLFDGGPQGGRVPFWLSLRRESPDFRLAVLPQPQPRLNDTDRQIHLWTPVLRRGETQPLRVVAFRRDGFNGPIELTATGLPPGVTATPTRIPPGQSAGSILLTAASDAPPGHAPVTALGQARIGERDTVHAATPATATWPVTDWDQERTAVRPMANLMVSVCGAESAPITLTPTSPSPVSVPTAGKVSIPFAIRRSDLFPTAFSLRLFGHPEAEKRKELAVPEKATNTVLELDLAETRLPAGTHTLWVQGLVPGKYRNNPEAIAPAEAELKAATEAVAAASAEAKPAAEQRRIAAEAARKAAEDRAKPRDLTTAVYSQPFTVRIQPPQP